MNGLPILIVVLAVIALLASGLSTAARLLLGAIIVVLALVVPRLL